jgi:4-hydroxybenzoate polyprenyltransferase
MYPLALPPAARGFLEHARTRLVLYARLVRLDRPIGIWLLLWPALWGLWVAAHGHPHASVFITFVAGVLLMRSAGCAVNDWADRKIDPLVARTRDRPLAAGLVSGREALAVFSVLALLALALVLRLNTLTQLYAIGGAALTVVYPFLKRYVSLPQFWLGAAFSWSIPMAFAAETGAVPKVAWLLFLAGLLWSVVYDTIYAMVDREDDRNAGVRSTALLFGEADRAVIAILQLLVLYALWLAGSEAHGGAWYDRGILAGALCFAWQQWRIRSRRPEDCYAAFLGSHWFGLWVFLGIALDTILRRG